MAFKAFLDNEESKRCRDKLGPWIVDEVPDLVGRLKDEVDRPIFYITNLFKDAKVTAYIPNFEFGGTFAELFAPRSEGQVYAVTNPGPAGAPGIYTPQGPLDPFFTGPDGLKNLLHELFHYVSKKTDANILGEFKFPKKELPNGELEDDYSAVTRWFQEGCPDAPKKEGE